MESVKTDAQNKKQNKSVKTDEQKNPELNWKVWRVMKNKIPI